MQCIKMLNLLVLKLINHLTAKSRGLRWGTKYLFLIFTSSKGSIIIHHLPRRSGGGEVDNFRGSHDFQGERRGEQLSPKEFKGGTVEIGCQF